LENVSGMPPTDPISDRLVRVESALMHLEHDVAQLNEAILMQQREIESLRRSIERFEAVLEREGGLASEVRDPEAEKPPHY